MSELSRSVDFYRALLGVDPSKVKRGYAKFEPEEPPVNLSLSESSAATRRSWPIHYGIQVKSSGEVGEMADRLRRAGLSVQVEERTACCYAVQDKVWVTDPDGNPWEVFVVLGDLEERNGSPSSCCGGSESNAG